MRIGIISKTNISGQGYMCLDLVKIFKNEGYNVFVLGRNRAEENIDFDIEVENYPNETIPKDVIQYWIREKKLTHCIFIGYDLIKDIKIIGGIVPGKIKTINIPLYKNIQGYKNKITVRYDYFDLILCPNEKTYKLFNCEQAKLVEWGYDEEIFKPASKKAGDTDVKIIGEKEIENDIIRFFCPMMPNDLEFKKTILNAFLDKRRIDITENGELKPKSLLYIHILSNKAPVNYQMGNIIISECKLTRKQMVEKYQEADIVILPDDSSVDLNCLEAIGCGTVVMGFFSSNIIAKDDCPTLIESGWGKKYCSDWISWFQDTKKGRNLLKKNILNVREDYSWKKRKQKLIDTIRKL